MAGALAITLAFVDTQALIGGPAGVPAITVTRFGDVGLAARYATAVTAKATPTDGGTSGEDVGVGAAVAISVAESSVRAMLADGVYFAGDGTMVLDADLDQVVTTEAESGAKGATALTPVVAVSVVSSDVRATLGSGDMITLAGGGFQASAGLTDAISTTATGDTSSGGTGIGMSVAVSSPA